LTPLPAASPPSGGEIDKFLNHSSKFNLNTFKHLLDAIIKKLMSMYSRETTSSPSGGDAAGRGGNQLLLMNLFFNSNNPILYYSP
jgi:hypothetical protein